MSLGMKRRDKAIVAVILLVTYAVREIINRFKMMYFAFFFGTYLITFVFFSYYCMFADPAQSRLAHLFTIEIPVKLHAKASQLLGPTVVDVFTTIGDSFLYIIYCTIVFGSWGVIFLYTYPWIDESDGYVSRNHKIVGVLVFGACVATWQFASRQSPGIITSHSIEQYDNYPYDGVLFVKDRICPTVGIRKLPRSKFDRYGRYQHGHVAKFDHFCGWLGNSVGELNYRWFLLFLLVHVGMCAYGAVVLYHLFQYEIAEAKLWEVTFYNRMNGEEFKATWFIVIQYLFQRNKLHAGLLLLMTVMAFTLSLFLLYHVWIASRGMTTNESSKWDQVKKWHRLEMKRYKEAVKQGLVVEGENKTAASKQPDVKDGDVTCTGAAAAETSDGTKDDDKQSETIVDPGPMPKNIYNQGFVENWRDILYPRSLRPEAIARRRKAVKERGQANQTTVDPPSTKPKAS